MSLVLDSNDNNEDTIGTGAENGPNWAGVETVAVEDKGELPTS